MSSLDDGVDCSGKWAKDIAAFGVFFGGDLRYIGRNFGVAD